MNRDIKLKTWVPPEERRYAKEIYKLIRKESPKIAATIEALVYSSDLEEFWLRVAKNPNTANDSFVCGSLYNALMCAELTQPKITRSQMKETVEKCADHVKKISRLVKSDPGVEMYFQTVLIEVLSNYILPLRKKPDPGSTRIITDQRVFYFLDDLACRLIDTKTFLRIDTHRDLPAAINRTEMSERVCLMNNVTRIVRYVYGRPYHTVTAKILNAIRPDLGNFSPDNIRQVVNTEKRNG